MNTYTWEFSEALVQAYAPVQAKVKQVNYFSPDFKKILTIINSFLAPFGVPQFKYESSTLTQSKYDKIKENGSCLMWRVTSDDLPALKILCERQIRMQLINQLQGIFPSYMANKVVKINTFDLGKKASIVIMPCGLDDNTWTSDDLKNYYKDSLVKQKLDEIEQRMFRRAGDNRSTETRWDAYIDADDYENKLPKLRLTNISNLTPSHSLIYYSLEPQAEADFRGNVFGKTCNIEAKSKKHGFTYNESAFGKYEFATYWESIKSSLGSLHNADFILLIDKVDGKIVCVERLNPENNWLAGKLFINEVA